MRGRTSATTRSRSRAYRWGEDGLAGISDEKQRLCLALALWNGRDPILKERLFGLTNAEGNHGEDVKEYYFYVDNVPTHSYQRWLYKYPHAEFPYANLVDTNRSRSRHEMEYELLDTGVFDEGRYFDVEVEYVKALSRRHPVPHHGSQPIDRFSDAARAPDLVVPQHMVVAPTHRQAAGLASGGESSRVSRPSTRSSACSTSTRTHGAELLFCENESNNAPPVVE